MKSPAIEPEWGAARQRVATDPWAAEIMERVREDFAWWQSRVSIPPPGADSEWTHHYFCDDGTRLRFDPEQPHHHACPECGRVYAGELWDGAWRTQMHNAAASQAQRAVLLLRLGEDPAETGAAREALLTILERYASDYGRYPVHGDKVGTGKVMPQNLDESIWAIALLRAVRWGGEALPAQTVGHAERIAEQVAALLEPQLGMVHNIHCWLLAALAECGVRTEDEALLERLRSGPFGIETQIREGIRREGLWYETSAFYHYYALAALLSYREVTGVGGLAPAEAEILGRAVEAPATLAYADGLLPAYGDCWPFGHLEDFAAHVAVAAAVLPECEIDAGGYRLRGDQEQQVDLWIGSRWGSEGSRPMTGLSSVAALVFGPGPLEVASEVPPRRSFLWPDAGIGAVSSDRARITMRFGRDVGMHDHRDKLALDIEVPGVWRSLDLGSGGYGAEFTQWMRSPAAHNIATIHDEKQPAVDASLNSWSEDRMEAEVSWGDRRIRRSITLTRDGWTDDVELWAGIPGPLTWILHGDGEILADGDPVGAGTIGALPGLVWLREVRRLDADRNGELTATWNVPGAPRLSVSLPPGAVAYAAQADGNPTGHALGVVLLRVEAEETRFSTRFVLP